MAALSSLVFKILSISLGTSSGLMSLYNNSNSSIKSKYSVSVCGMPNCKPLDKRDPSYLVRLYLEKMKITVLES